MTPNIIQNQSDELVRFLLRPVYTGAQCWLEGRQKRSHTLALLDALQRFRLNLVNYNGSFGESALSNFSWIPLRIL